MLPRRSEVRAVGLTGGIGAGKSTVAALFRELGVPCYDSDRRAHALMEEDEALRRALVDRFGERIYTACGLDRIGLAARVFGDAQALSALEELVHPAVGRDYAAWQAAKRAAGAPYTLLESAILFESGFDRLVDRTITVTAPLEERVRRVAERDGATSEQVRRRIAVQLDDAERERRSDYLVRNDDRTSLAGEVERLHRTFCGQTKSL